MRISKTNIRQRSVLFVLFLSAWLPDGYGQKAEQGHDAYYWTDIRDLGIMGKGWKQDTLLYNRLPAKTEGVVRDPVWSLSTHTAGFYVRFASNAIALRARWKLRYALLYVPGLVPEEANG